MRERASEDEGGEEEEEDLSNACGTTMLPTFADGRKLEVHELAHDRVDGKCHLHDHGRTGLKMNSIFGQ